jgi:hypothetical protein
MALNDREALEKSQKILEYCAYDSTNASTGDPFDQFFKIRPALRQ